MLKNAPKHPDIFRKFVQKKSLYSRCFQVNNNMSKGTFLYIKDYSRSRYNNRNIIYSA